MCTKKLGEVDYGFATDGHGAPIHEEPERVISEVASQHRDVLL